MICVNIIQLLLTATLLMVALAAPPPGPGRHPLALVQKELTDEPKIMHGMDLVSRLSVF